MITPQWKFDQWEPISKCHRWGEPSPDMLQYRLSGPKIIADNEVSKVDSAGFSVWWLLPSQWKSGPGNGAMPLLYFTVKTRVIKGKNLRNALWSEGPTWRWSRNSHRSQTIVVKSGLVIAWCEKFNESLGKIRHKGQAHYSLDKVKMIWDKFGGEQSMH